MEDIEPTQHLLDVNLKNVNGSPPNLLDSDSHSIVVDNFENLDPESLFADIMSVSDISNFIDGLTTPQNPDVSTNNNHQDHSYPASLPPFTVKKIKKKKNSTKSTQKTDVKTTLPSTTNNHQQSNYTSPSVKNIITTPKPAPKRSTPNPSTLHPTKKKKKTNIQSNFTRKLIFDENPPTLESMKLIFNHNFVARSVDLNLNAGIYTYNCDMKIADTITSQANCRCVNNVDRTNIETWLKDALNISFQNLFAKTKCDSADVYFPNINNLQLSYTLKVKPTHSLDECWSIIWKNYIFNTILTNTLNSIPN